MQKNIYLAIAVLFSSQVVADENSEIQDMSDPLAVYTQMGVGTTDKGVNIKLGQSFDTGSDTTMGMNVFEFKGLMGETFGWRDEANNSVDSMRFRNFGVDLTNGRGSQLDVNYDFNNESGAISYSLIQALPAYGPLQLYPLVGVGAAFGNNVVGDDDQMTSGYSVPGTFGMVGLYSKLDITDNVWLNYNPMWMSSLSGSDTYKEQGVSGESSAFAHEFIVSYQLAPRSNIRYYANWTEHDSFKSGDHRIEFNYQF
ncbi:hypothetical protein GCM10009347_00900 [Shewanella algicola]|uniref:Porin n=1 Tax=Shewanella algicola TaxID=640633 RepID=A0A9X2CAX0_9GAMM|nr:hypothetical protein [Shewanella algicola]MCL1103808.1 hypothetical protein [Shewanella algicola]GGP36880.1 hypothetical protein GCM10009347_00900 [Shewanella algicola]